MEEIAYQSKRLKQVSLAHDSSIIVVSRNRELARKLRPEFKNCYICKEFKDYHAIISRHSNDPEQKGIDFVILDADSSSIKILDNINKRIKTEATSKLRIIGTILLFSKDTDQQIKDNIAFVGGADHSIYPPYTSQVVLLAILDALSRSQIVHDEYLNLSSRAQQIKFPYLPIFENSINKKSYDSIDYETDDTNDSDYEGSIEEDGDLSESSKNDNNSIYNSLEAESDLVDDWTQTSSIHPKFVSDYRKIEKEKQQSDSPPPNQTRADKLIEQHSIDKKISNTISNLQVDLDNIELNNDFISPTYGKILPISMEDAIKRSNTVTADDTDNSVGNSVGSVGIKIEKNRRNANLNMQLMYIQNNVDQAISTSALLDIGRRPKWGANVEIDPVTNRLINTTIDSKIAGMELRPFIHKSGSNKNDLKKTIGGFDKKTTDYLWKVINSKTEKKSVIKIKDSENSYSRNSSKVNVLGSNCSSPRHALTKKGSNGTGSNNNLLEKSNSLKFSSSGNVLEKSSTMKLLSKTSTVDDLQDHDLELIDESEFTGLPVVNQNDSLVKYKSLFSMDKGNKREKARKAINKISNKLAADIYVSQLLEVDFSRRKINIGEREHLNNGRAHEEVNEFDEAMACYARACLVNAKQPHTGNIYQGICLYHQGKFIAAINSFSLALRILERALDSNYNVDDHFVTVYNRGITYFRVGNDDNGLLDFKKAVSLKPDHNGTREVYAMALRRVDRYSEAIELILQNKKVRLDKEYELEDIKNAKALKQQLKLDAMRQRKSSPSFDSTKRSSPSFDDSYIGDDDDNSLGQSIGSILIKSDINRRGSINDKSRKTHGKTAEDIGTKIEIVDAETICNGGLKTLVANKILQVNNDSEGDIGGKSLKTVKKSLGLNDDIFDSLFVKASSLQIALATSPGIRTKEHIETIVYSLRLMPFLRNVSQSGLDGIASVIEYRALPSPGTILFQNEQADAMVFLLKGQIKMVQDNIVEKGNTPSHQVIGMIEKNSCVGHIDLLFRREGSHYIKEYITNYLKVKEAENPSDESAIDDISDLGIKNGINNSVPKIIKNKKRPMKPPIFASYSTTGVSEILILDHYYFAKYLQDHARDELNKRLQIISSCGLFNDWSKIEHIRLARMGQVRTYKSGDILLEQGVLPEYLYFIMKGMCRAFKRPSRTEIFTRKLNELMEKEKRYDIKYAFHHKLRHTLTKAPKEELKQDFIDQSCVTQSELNRHKLALEIKKYEVLVAKAHIQDLKDKQEEEEEDHVHVTENEHLCEISTLQWPMLFGEACILEPETGASRGTIIADTRCDIFLVHKSQMQTFHIDEKLFDRISYRSIRYPEDSDLVVQIEKKKKWKIYRSELMNDIPKERWPSRETDLEPFHTT